MTANTLFSLRTLLLSAAASAALIGGGARAEDAAKPHNVIIFVADGLRSGIVDETTAPTLAAIRKDGVDFHNSHSLYPTVTTVNASAIATGHRIGDTGEYANSLFLGWPALKAAFNNPIGDMEDDTVLVETDSRFGGNYLNEVSLLAAARAAGFATAAIGKEGPVLIQDIDASDGKSTIIIDDHTGFPDGVPVRADILEAIKAAGLETQARDRGLNGSAGYYNLAGVHVANTYQQDWFSGVAAEAVLPALKASGKPFVMLYWSRDPDGTQHANGDSLNTLVPGINGPTSLAGVRNASDNLQKLRDKLKALGLEQTTDIVVTADHGFSTISRQSETSGAAKRDYPNDTVHGFLPVGFVAIDLAAALNLPLLDTSGVAVDLASGFHPRGSAMLGADAAHPDALVVSGGGSDLIYLDPAKAKDLAPKFIAALVQQDYVGGLFVDDALGQIPGTLPFSAIGLKGSGKTPVPSIYISFKSTVVPGCLRANPELCAAEVADTSLQQGQGIHGAFSRTDSHNFMAAIGPDFKAGFVDPAPISNADLTPTLAKILGISLPSKGSLTGRVIAEALPGGAVPVSTAHIVKSQPAANGFVTILNTQTVGAEVYLDAAGAPGRVVGLKEQ